MQILQVERNRVLYFIDRKSFPVKCPELDDFISLIRDDCDVAQYENESPTLFFKEAVKQSEDYELVIPVTRNMFVRDKLRVEGVSLVICL